MAPEFQKPKITGKANFININNRYVINISNIDTLSVDEIISENFKEEGIKPYGVTIFTKSGHSIIIPFENKEEAEKVVFTISRAASVFDMTAKEIASSTRCKFPYRWSQSSPYYGQV